MIPAIWPISVLLEAALAYRLGGFPAFRRFLWCDVAIQCGAMAFADSPRYREYEGVATVAGLIALAPAVWEARTIQDSLKVARLLVVSAGASILAYLLLAKPGYALTASTAWAATGLFHSMGAVFLFAGMWINGINRHALLLATWLLADAALFYLAPVLPVGDAVLWLNAGAWAVWLLVARFSRLRR